MANLIVNMLNVSGPAEDRERLKAAVETSTTFYGKGTQCLKEYIIDSEKWNAAIPEWGDVTVVGILESSYSYECANRRSFRPDHVTKDDGRPVRIVDDVLIIKIVTNWYPPIHFVERLGKLFPQLEVTGSSLDLTNADMEKWRSRAGETELLERRCSVFLSEEIFAWEKQGHIWRWLDEREADIEMMREFLSLECAAEPDELRTACRLAYDALAFPETTVHSRVTNYAYDLARTIAEYRHALALAAMESDSV